MGEAFQKFGNFILFKEAFQDSFGQFYRAGEFDQTGVKRTVWFRLFNGPGVPKEDVRQELEKARQVSSLINAANVASGAVYVEEDGIPAMAFDHTAGHLLSCVFKKVNEEGFPIPVDNALLIMEKLALGLSSALILESGGQALAHGMLHPGMVLITTDGEGIVAGFGLGESLLGLLDDAAAAAEMKPYLAPEVILTKTPGKKGDVYSLGAILFHLLTGSPLPEDPAARAEAFETAEMAYDGEPIPNDIKSLLSRSIAQRPEDRFSSAADFKKELDKLLYGGTYSPTTFNLALFMDRLFRAEIEQDEADLKVEAEVDVQDYLAPEPEEEPVEIPTEAPKKGMGLWIGVAAAAVVILGIIGFFAMRGSQPSEPVLTAEEIAAQRADQEQRIRDLASQLVEEKMKEQEDKIRGELEESQQRIEDLQQRLRDSQKKSTSDADKERAEAELQRQIEAEKEKQRQREEQLEQERKQAEEEAREEAAAKAAEEQQAEPDPVEVAQAEPTPTIVPATPTPKPVTVTENQFLEPSMADTLPAVIKEEDVKWPNAAKRARRRGMVIVQATVDASGRVEAVKILRTDEDGFGIPEAVTDAVKKYVFKPGTKEGVNIKTHATVVKRYAFR